MIGRDTVLDDLIDSARRAAADALPAMAWVIGEPGQGKSHLFRILVKRLGETAVAEVLALRAREPALGDADHTLASLLQRTLDLPATAPPDGGRELLRERLAQASSPRSPASATPAGSTRQPPATRDAPRAPAGTADARSLGARTTDERDADAAPPRPRHRRPSVAVEASPESRAPTSGADLGPAVALALGWVVPVTMGSPPARPTPPCDRSSRPWARRRARSARR